MGTSGYYHRPSRSILIMLWLIAVNVRREEVSNNRLCIEKYIMPFGKYQGDFVSDIAMENPDYLKWLKDKQIDDQLKEAIEYHLEWSTRKEN